MNDILVSIIIPVYNGELYLEECLDSIMEQTYKNLEVIIINDGSTDNTQQIINIYKEKYNFIHSYYQENKGQGVARNKAIELAKGDYVAFIDADDLIHENFITSLLTSITEQNADFAVCDWIYYRDNGSLRYSNRYKFMAYNTLEFEQTELLLSGVPYFTVNKLYKKDFLLKNKIRYGQGYIYEDCEFYVKSCVLANKISIVPNPYYYVRRNSWSTTQTKYKNRWHYDSALKAFEASLSKIKFKSSYGKYYTLRYFVNRTYMYSSSRMPKKLQKSFVTEAFKIFSKYNDGIKVHPRARKLNKYIFNYLLPKNKVRCFIFLNKLKSSIRLKNMFNFIKNFKFKNIFRKYKAIEKQILLS